MGRPEMAGLGTLIASVRYKPGWAFKIAGPDRTLLCIYATTADSCGPGQRCTQHQFPIPASCDDWERWLFDRLLLCELHEAGEFYTVNGERPFYPNHQDEGSPYDLVDRRPKWH